MEPASNLTTLADQLATLTDSLAATVGIAVATASGAAAVIGPLRTGAAWSTAKVPLAMAALTAHPGQRTAGLVRRALRDSDNAAAQALWDDWDDPVRAAAAVRAVLREADDNHTTVPSRRSRDGFSVVGQTEWALVDQAEFGARLACLPHGRSVLTEMRRVSSGQQWGLAAPAIVDRSQQVAVKGGWGPDQGGGYLVRQLAVVTPDRGSPWVAALATRPASGQFADGTAALTAVAEWLIEHLRVTGADTCR